MRGKALWKRGVDIIKEDVSDGNYIECLIRSADYTHIFVFEDNIHANIEEIRSFHKVILDSIKDIKNITVLPVISKPPNILTTMDITHDIKLRLLSNMYERYSKDHHIRTIMVNIESIVIGDGLDSESGVMNILDQLQNDSAVQIEQQLGSAVEERFQTPCTGDDRIDRELCNKITKVSHVTDVIKHITDELANPIHDDWFNAIIIDMGEEVSISEFVDSLKSALDGFSYLKCMKGYEDAKDLKLPLEIVTHQHKIAHFVDWFLKRNIGLNAELDSFYDRRMEESLDDKSDCKRYSNREVDRKLLEQLKKNKEKYLNYSDDVNISDAEEKRTYFAFFEGVTSSGGDLEIVFPRLRNDITELRKECLKIPTCIAFLTNGTLKSNVRTKHYWKKVAEFGKDEGMYIADINVCEESRYKCKAGTTCVYISPGQFGCDCGEGYEETVTRTCLPLYNNTEIQQQVHRQKMALSYNGVNIDPLKDGAEFVKISNVIQAGTSFMSASQHKENTTELKAICRNTPLCIGFNYYGLLMNKFRPFNTWLFGYDEVPGHDVYVLDLNYCLLADKMPNNKIVTCYRIGPGMYNTSNI
ncbi:unnamed protein product [Owenia fusiformis]|uniref:EGF-like domain-containing protein n=1 Tax=Owenia fusiformis TaxID=6347 RepID=A0A8S4P4T6_OWEFU|nr:unnamed protein product [Owenia fusiformis]